MSTDFEDFYRTHHAAAVRWAVALVGSREVAEDLAQDCLESVGRRLATVDDPPAYLRRSVVNRAKSWHRSHLRERRRVLKVAAGEPLTYTEPTRELLDSLTALPYKQRAAVTLRYWADWSDEEIAAALGCAPTSVRVLVHRGVNALRSGLKEVER